MACGKEILLFDEPTSGLDYGSMIRVRDLFYDLAGLNKLIFVVSHDYEFIGSVCSRIIRLHQGHLIQDFALDDKGISRIQPFFNGDDNPDIS